MRLWEFGVQDCRLDQLTISLTITSLPLNESLHDAARAGLDFPRQSSRFYQINERRPRPGRFSTKLIFLYFSWCSFQSFFKKLTCLSCLAHTGENSWEIAKRELSNWQLLIQFLVKLWHTELSWDRGDMVPSQLLGDGQEYSNLKFVKNVSDRRAKR